MNSPICDFVKNYADSGKHRLHMPGHKGKLVLGCEPYDITEIDGADSLFEASGIIRESEKNASELFKAHTFYSTEGSSLSIRTMLALTVMYARKGQARVKIAAARNAHRAFMTAAALLDFDIIWLPHDSSSSYLSCAPSAKELESFLTSLDKMPTAIYITSPDYLGSLADIGGISEVCKAHGILLLVDNAHGAYLKFLPHSLHPIDLGADMCCDSAHKTLPTLTGAAYLHVSLEAPAFFSRQAKSVMSMFASTSPSYLILQSLDAVNPYLAKDFRSELEKTVCEVKKIRLALVAHGYRSFGNEPLKLTLCPKSYGYSGRELADMLAKYGIICEFCDTDYVVLMPSTKTDVDELAYLCEKLCSIPKKAPIIDRAPASPTCERVMTVREASLCMCETIRAADAVGRVLACATVACPPAVPIVACGERINEEAVKCFEYYGIEYCNVVK